MKLFSVEDYLRRMRVMRPSNFFRPSGFYPRGSDDSFWDYHSDHFLQSSGSGFLISVEWSRLCSGNARLSLVDQARTGFVLMSASWFFFAAWLIHADSLIWSKSLDFGVRWGHFEVFPHLEDQLWMYWPCASESHYLASSDLFRRRRDVGCRRSSHIHFGNPVSVSRCLV